MATAVFILTAYLIGSLSFAVIVSRAFALPDPRSYGSGNPGATNVLRTGKKLAALLTLIGDGGKGWLAVFLALRYAAEDGVDATGVAACAVAVFLGHIFPVFFRFKGGKGVSTAGGILLAVNPWLGVAAIATWFVIALFFRYSSLACTALLFFPVRRDRSPARADHHGGAGRLAPQGEHSQARRGRGTSHRRKGRFGERMRG